MLAKELATSYKVDRLAFNESFDRVLNDPKEVVFIAKNNHNIIGYCLGSIHITFYANGDVAWLEELYVKSDYRGLDVGMKLVSTFENWAKQHHAILITLATRRAESFYLTMGYQKSASYFKKQISTSSMREA